MLSVCIPTRNRLDYLKISLPIVVEQAREIGAQVCVSDNNSVDGTDIYLKELVEKYNFIKYIKHDRDLSIDENMSFAILMADNDYIYPFGDDDYLLDGAFGDIYKNLVDGVDLLILDYIHTDSSFKTGRRGVRDSVRGLVFDDPYSAFEKMDLPLHFSSFVASKRIYTEERLSRYFGTSHAYVGAALDGVHSIYLSHGISRVKFHRGDTVLIRGGEKTWGDHAAFVNLYQFPLWFNFLCDKYKEIRASDHQMHLRTLFSYRVLSSYRASGSIDFYFFIIISRDIHTLKLRQLANLFTVTIMPVCLSRIYINVYNKQRQIFIYFRKILRKIRNINRVKSPIMVDIELILGRKP